MDNPATNTTTPSNPPYKWVGESKQRSTFGIFSICFSTLIICIWSTLHFDIPAKRYTTTRRFFIQISWMIFALLAPEVLLYLAIHEWIKVDELLKEVHRFHPHLAKPGLFTRMYNWIRGRAEPKDKRYNVEQTPQSHFGRVHAYYAIMGGFAFYDSYDDDTPKSLVEISINPRCTVDVPDTSTLLYIMEHFPHIITDIAEDDILDRAASSSLSKALLIVQVGWFCTNCASRLFQHLPLSLLEVSTAAHAACTLLTYFVWWSKPLNVAAPTLLREKAAREVYALLKCSDDEYDKAFVMAQKRAAGDSSISTGPHGSEKIVLAAGALHHLLPTPKRSQLSTNVKMPVRMLVPGIFRISNFDKNISIPLTLCICPMIYGLPHFLAWGDQFPTPLERLLWHVSSFVVTCSGLAEGFLGFSPGLLDQFTTNGTVGDVFIMVWGLIFMLVVPLAHVLASGFLIVESVRQLFFLTDAAYQLPSWSNYWPHLS